MKRLFASLLLLCGLPLLASDSTIGNLSPITTVPDTYVTVWENVGVSDVKITFLNLTNQMLAGYASQAFALSAAQNATNGLGSAAFKATGFFDLAGAGTTAAHDATNTFPWGVLYDPANAAHNATNGFPWGVLYDPVNSAYNSTNGFPWMTLNLVTNTFSGSPTLHASVDGSATTAGVATNPAIGGNLPGLSWANTWTGTNIFAVTSNTGSLGTGGAIRAGGVVYASYIDGTQDYIATSQFVVGQTYGYGFDMRDSWSMAYGGAEGVLWLKGANVATVQPKLVFGGGTRVSSSLPASLAKYLPCLSAQTNAIPSFTLIAGDGTNSCNLAVSGAISATNGFGVLATNAAPSNVTLGVTAPDFWNSYTNTAGQKVFTPGWINH